MRNLLKNQPSLKLVECKDPNLSQATLPALVRFECMVKLPKTNSSYKKLHELVDMKYFKKFLEASGGDNFSLRTQRHLTPAEQVELEQQITEEGSVISKLRNFNLVYFPGTTVSQRIEVETIEPQLEIDQSNPIKYKAYFKLVSKQYLIKEYLGKDDYRESFLYARASRVQDFVKGKRVKFERLKVEPYWVKIREAEPV